MGKEKTTTVIDRTEKAEPTEMETKFLEEQFKGYEQTRPRQTELQLQSMDVISRLFGGEELPGAFGEIFKGIPEISPMKPEDYMLGEQDISAIAQRGISDLPAYFQGSGILDSGVSADIMAGTAADIRTGLAESNLARAADIEQFNRNLAFSRGGFNIGNLLNLLNLGVGGQAQVQQPMLAQQSQLAQSLAGLRTMRTHGTQTVKAMNPFLKSFQTGLGGGLGTFIGGRVGGGLPGFGSGGLFGG